MTEPFVMPTWGGHPRFFSDEVLREYDQRHPIPSTRAGGGAYEHQVRELKRVGWHLLRRGCDPQLSLDLLIAFNTHRGMPPIEQAEVEKIFNDLGRWVLSTRGVSRAA
jgi:hypothetical protein